MTGADIRFVEGDLADLDAVMDVMEASFDPAYGEGWTAPQCAGLMPLPGVWLTLAKDASGAIAFALSRIVADEAELLLLAVDPTRQRRGVGRNLVKSFVETAAERGASRLHLEVRDDNPAAGLYRSCGFHEAGRRRDYYRGSGGELRDALTFVKLIEKTPIDLREFPERS